MSTATVVLSFSEAEVTRLVSLVPWVESGTPDRADQARRAIEYLASAEDWRRGGRDGLTPARSAWGLRSGALVEPQERLPNPSGPVPAVLRFHAIGVDVVELAELNAHHGFQQGDRALCRLASALVASFPERLVVRMGGDSFAAISQRDFGPLVDRAGLEATLATALRGAGAEELAPCPSRFTIAELELTVRHAHDRAIVGALVAGEMDRALGVQRREGELRVHRREFDLGPAA